MEKDIMFNQMQAAAGREIEAGGQRWLFFGGTAYLGLQQHPRMLELYLRGMQQYGINNGTSRNNNVQLAVYSEAEAAAAKRFGAEAALITSSGYLAAQMAVKQLARSAQVLYAPATHPSLWLQENPGVGGSFEHWALETVSYINSSLHNHFLVISNTLNNLLPESYDFSAFKNVHPHKKIHFLLDDSHGIGILPQRQWVPAHPGFSVTLVASMAKGLGTDAGLVLSDAATIAQLKQSSIFLGASPPAPAAMYTFLHAEQICHEQREKLHRNMQYFQQHHKGACQYTPGFPVYYFPEAGLFEKLLQQNIVISSFPYPQPADPVLNRVVISSLHTREDIDLLLLAIHQAQP
jgi:8-amino-7-oxononanoate synthase